MLLHGGYEPVKILKASALPPVFGESFGYRNIFGPVRTSRTDPPDPTVQEVFQGYGFREGERERTVALLAKLGKRMREPYSWDSVAEGGRRPDDNPNIPSGYTYLAQLLTHDLTFVGSTLPSVNDALLDQRNLRTIALNLETIYSGGPLERPSCFCIEKNGAPRYRLRVGLIADQDGRFPDAPERRATLSRDLPRTACPLTSDDPSELSEARTEVQISDARNDDHLIIAQTAVLFHLLHNAVCDILGNADADWTANRTLFAASRRVVTAVYRKIVGSDLMKRLLCEPVYERYTMLDDPFLDKQGDTRIPVEFSHAGFRIGHAMVRPGYQIRDNVFGLEDVLMTSSQALPDRMPPNWPWIIRWSRFYELDGGKPANLSRRLSPSFARALFTSPLFSLSEETKLDAAQAEILVGLPGRDLVRGATVYMRSVESLIQCIGKVAPELIEASALLRDREHRRDTIARYLVDGRLQSTAERFSDEDIATLAADPPLFFFLLLEAAAEQDGMRLGVLGSIIVAEVVFRALETPAHFEAEGVPDVSELLPLAFPEGAPGAMPDLIGFLDKHYGPKDEPVFV